MFSFWQVRLTHAAFAFGTLARAMTPVRWNADVSVCCIPPQPARYPGCLSGLLSGVCVHQVGIPLLSIIAKRGNLISVKPCDGKRSLNTVKNSREVILFTRLKSEGVCWSPFFFFFLAVKTQSYFLTSLHVKGQSQKLWPCYSIHWTQAAASLQPLSIKAQLVTPKTAFEKTSSFQRAWASPQQPANFCVCSHPCTSSMSVWLQLLARPSPCGPHQLKRDSLIDCLKSCRKYWPSLKSVISLQFCTKKPKEVRRCRV